MIRIGVIGLGRWGPNHVRVFCQLQGCRVVAVADSNPTLRSKFGQRHPGLVMFSSALDLVKHSEVDAVVIATPTKTHARLAQLALRNRKHVLCEKPLCTRVSESVALQALARKMRRILMVGHVFLFNRGIQRVRQLLHSGVLGEPRSLSAIRTNLGPVRSDVNAAWDLASHDVAIFNWLLGAEPKKVRAMGASFLQPGVEDVVNIAMRYPGNVLATIHCSWLDPKKVRQITLVCSKKMVTWDDLSLSHPVMIHEKKAETNHDIGDYGQFLRISLLEGDVHLIKVAAEEPLRLQAEAFLRACRTGKVAVSGVEFASGVVRTLKRVQSCLRK
jgi:predicted dehydrogenase